MFSFGQRSKSNLITCHPDIRFVMNESIKIIDFSVLCGVRSMEKQNRAYNEGNSKLKWPHSKHNVDPDNPRDIEWPNLSTAVDIVPYPIDWENLGRFHALADIIKQIAKDENVDLHWGYDLWGWDMPHWQLEI